MNELIRKFNNKPDEITKIMVNEYGYKIIEENDTPIGTHYWKLSKVKKNNKKMNESYIFFDIPTIEDTKREWRKLTPMIVEGLKRKRKGIIRKDMDKE
jgi:hypothetical protein